MIKIINETGLVNDTTVVDTETGNEITGVSLIELVPMEADNSVAIRLTFNRVQLQLGSKVVSIVGKGSFEG